MSHLANAVIALLAIRGFIDVTQSFTLWLIGRVRPSEPGADMARHTETLINAAMVSDIPRPGYYKPPF